MEPAGPGVQTVRGGVCMCVCACMEEGGGSAVVAVCCHRTIVLAKRSGYRRSWWTSYGIASSRDRLPWGAWGWGQTSTQSSAPLEVRQKWQCAVHLLHMWQSQVENEHYSTVSGLIRSLECCSEITPDFLCPFMND